MLQALTLEMVGMIISLPWLFARLGLTQWLFGLGLMIRQIGNTITDLHSIVLGVLALEPTGPTREQTGTSCATTTFAGDAATPTTADGSGSTVHDSTMGFASRYATG